MKGRSLASDWPACMSGSSGAGARSAGMPTLAGDAGAEEWFREELCSFADVRAFASSMGCWLAQAVVSRAGRTACKMRERLNIIILYGDTIHYQPDVQAA